METNRKKNLRKTREGIKKKFSLNFFFLISCQEKNQNREKEKI
jgi:hypothetical protein